LNSQGRSQLRRTVCREEMEDGGEGTAEKRVPEALRGPAESAFGIRTNIFAAVGFTELRGEGMPCEIPRDRTAAKIRSRSYRAIGERRGLGDWRLRFLAEAADVARRGGSVEAGEAPACTTAAARGRMPEHAVAGWLTDHPSSVTIKTTPRDRLAITGKIMGGVRPGWL
jgi:hypothetical protein